MTKKEAKKIIEATKNFRNFGEVATDEIIAKIMHYRYGMG